MNGYVASLVTIASPHGNRKKGYKKLCTNLLLLTTTQLTVRDDFHQSDTIRLKS